MKPLKILPILFLLSSAVMAQVKDTTHYAKVIIVPAQDYQSLIQIAYQYRNLVLYAPSMNERDKVAEMAGMDKYLNQLQQRIKLDSVKLNPKTK